MNNISQFTRHKSLKRLLYNGALWGSYGQLITVSGPLLTGYALWMGLRAADIALVTAIASLAGLIQPFSFLLARKLKNKKTFVLGVGFLEITFMVSVIFTSFVARQVGLRLFMVACFVLLGSIMSHLVSPVFNSWFSSILPEHGRSRFLGSRLAMVNLSAMIAGYLAGIFIDQTEGIYFSFLVPYIVAWLVGIGGFLLLLRVPFPDSAPGEDSIPSFRMLFAPLRDMAFRRLLVFVLAWSFASLLSDPFYNVFMIQNLEIRYSSIALFNVIVLSVGILGYRFWGMVGEKFGMKPVLQMLLVPRMLLPMIWVFLTPGNATITITLIMVANGIVYSGLSVAVNTLLFGTVPQGDRATAYFAFWSFSISLVTFAASGSGSLLALWFTSVELSVVGLHLGGLRIIFLISTIVFLPAAVLVHRLKDVKATSVAFLLGQVMRGNTLSFALNSFRFSWIKEARTRARAIRAMGRSRSPMAVDHLLKAMTDVNPEVREQAVKGLGESGSEHAVLPLAEELGNRESEMRVTAAESLGKLRHPAGIDALLKALDSGDVRVAISAARALGDIGGEDVRDQLYKKTVAGGKKLLLPTLIESLSRLGDIRAVEPAMRAVFRYRSPVIRIQLINAACRSLGADNLFYSVYSLDELPASQQLVYIVKGIRRRISRLKYESVTKILAELKQIETDLVQGNYLRLPEEALRIAELVYEPPAEDLTLTVIGEAYKALRLFQELSKKVDHPEIFCVVCLRQLFHDAGKKAGKASP